MATAFKQVKDNAVSTTTTTLGSTGATSITVATGDGAKFPTPGTGFILTIWNGSDPTADPNMEKVTCTARTGDVLTITATTSTHTSPTNVALNDVASNTTDLQTAVNNLENTAVQVANDLGGTVTAPTVIATHLASPLPLTQGGTGSTTQNFTDLTTAQTVAGNKTFTSPLVINSTSATAFAVGPNGSTNPGLVVDNSVASSATGIKIQGQVAGGNVVITAISSGTNEGFVFNSKGTGNFRVTPGSDGANAFNVTNAANTLSLLTINTSTSVMTINATLTSLLATTARISITAAGSNIFTVGAAGTNYGLQVDTSTASAATGLIISSRAAGNGIDLYARSSNTNETLSLDSLGTGLLRLNVRAGTGQIQFGQTQIYPYTTVTATGTLTTAYSYVRVNSASATTQTLPAGPTAGTVIEIKNVNSGVVTVAGTIDGVTNYTLNTQNKYVQVMYNGTNWDVVGNN